MTEGNYNIDSDSATEDQSLFDWYNESGALDILDFAEGVDPREYRWDQGYEYERDVAQARAKQRQRESAEATKQAVREGISEANPQAQMAYDYHLLKKLGTKKDQATLSLGESLYRDKAHYEKELQQAEKLGDHERYKRAAWYLRETEARLADQPKLEITEAAEQREALDHAEGVVSRYHSVPAEQKKQLLPDLKEAIAIANNSNASFLLACDEEGRTYKIPTPSGAPAREVWEMLKEERDSGSDGRLQGFPDWQLARAAAIRGIRVKNNDMVEFGSKPSGTDDDDLITHDASGKPLRKPMRKAKPKKKAEPKGDVEVASALPGADNKLEYFTQDDLEIEQVNRKPKKRTVEHIPLWVPHQKY